MSKTATKPKPSANGKSAGVRAPAPAPGPVPEQIDGVVPLAQLKPSPLNPRKSFPVESIEQLAQSIGEQGLLQRILVRPVGTNGKTPALEGGKWRDLANFEIIDGERRYRALQLRAEDGTLGSDAVKVTVRPLTDAEALAIMLVANDQREDVRPSEQAAGYARLRETAGSDEAVAAAVGKSVGYVRGLLRLAKLPGWAMVAVDAGLLPRATAELVARVPGEESRKLAAGCVLQGAIGPSLLIGTADHPDLRGPELTPLSYRDTKKLLTDHFTKELKGSPFDRKSLDLLPEAGSCEACPKRAGNDPEAQAEGTRADVCLDPDCYRAKVAAHDERQYAKGCVGRTQRVPDDYTWVSGEKPPRGWCDIDRPAQDTELAPEFPPLKAGHVGPTLFTQLGLNRLKGEITHPDTSIDVFAALDAKHKLRFVAKTADIRKKLQRIGVLKKPEPRPKAERRSPGILEPTASAEARRISVWETDGKACDLATDVLRQHTESECSALDDHEDAHEDGPIRGTLELIARAVCYEFSQSREGEKALRERVVPDGDFDKGLDAAICAMKPSQMIGLLTAVSAQWELRDGPNRPTGESLLAWAELDWPALQEQARRVLSGGEPAEAKIAAADVADPAPVAPAPAAPNVERGGTMLRAVPSFPANACDFLWIAHQIDSVEQLEAKQTELAKRPAAKEITLYGTLRELGVLEGHILPAGDALVDWKHAQLEAETAPAAKPAKAKSKKAGAK